MNGYIDKKIIPPINNKNMENSLDPQCWGPSGWFFLHSITMGYPESNVTPETAALYKQFFESLEFVLPCVWCKRNYRRNLEQLPIDDHLGSRRELAEWLYRIHNLVNEETGVPQDRIPTFEEVYQKYNTFRADCNNSNRTCDSDERKCRMTIQNSISNKDTTKDTIYHCYWPLIIIIVGLLIALIVVSIYKNKK